MEQFLVSYELSAINTFKKKRSYSTKIYNLHSKLYTCDYILTETKDLPRVTDCGADPCAPLSSHFPIRCDFRVALRLRKLRPKVKPTPKVARIGLRDPAKARSFQTKVTTACSSDSMPYAEFTSAVNKAAKETLIEPRPHDPPWFKAFRPLLLPLIAR